MTFHPFISFHGLSSRCTLLGLLGMRQKLLFEEANTRSPPWTPSPFIGNGESICHWLRVSVLAAPTCGSVHRAELRFGFSSRCTLLGLLDVGQELPVEGNYHAVFPLRSLDLWHRQTSTKPGNIRVTVEWVNLHCSHVVIMIMIAAHTRPTARVPEQKSRGSSHEEFYTPYITTYFGKNCHRSPTHCPAIEARHTVLPSKPDTLSHGVGISNDKYHNAHRIKKYRALPLLTPLQLETPSEPLLGNEYLELE